MSPPHVFWDETDGVSNAVTCGKDGSVDDMDGGNTNVILIRIGWIHDTSLFIFVKNEKNNEKN